MGFVMHCKVEFRFYTCFWVYQAPTVQPKTNESNVFCFVFSNIKSANE